MIEEERLNAINSLELMRDILAGKHDKELDRIVEAIRGRRDIISRAQFYEFRVGDRVRFNDKVRPTYLAHLAGKITSKKQKKVVIELDTRPILGRFGKVITTPIDLIEKID